MVVLEIKSDDTAVKVTGILIMDRRLTFCREAEKIGMILDTGKR